MTTYRRYGFLHRAAVEGNHAMAAEMLDRACGEFHWYTDPEVTGLPFEVLFFAFTVTGRDQWWCHTRAMRLADEICRKLRITVPTPEWLPLPPHENRGYDRVTA